MKEKLPEGFKEEIKQLLKEDAESLLQALDTAPEISVRINKRKPGVCFNDTTPVEWCDSGFYLRERPEFILDPLLHAGAYYVQDASSMIYETLISKLMKELVGISGSGKLKVLDLCASPGGKATAIINALPDNAEIVANEYVKKRMAALQENLAKWGFKNVEAANRDSSYYAEAGERFDIVAVDAPCSGEGMMRKDEFARRQWSNELVEHCAALQKEILTNAEQALKPGGFLIYSTCTFNCKENEENALFITENLQLNPFDPGFPEEWGIARGIGTDLPVMRFMPHKTRGEGLFLAVFRKPGVWSPDNSSVLSGGRLKRVKDNTEQIPCINDILSTCCSLDEIPKVELSEEKAVAYLRRESIAPPEGTPRGVVILTYKGFNLGAGKNIGSRINNLYPKEWRILKR